ncbi:transcription repressor OFP6-like [Lycium ferocissimum]|uniref:transcription repressor OFP6-like n=1 Tax=Lycium ferocissimum TaxID=112874 RepID=UPI00281615ED|nr:transcription repressor OFP6-like [Lycium ferocissimum]
MSSKNKNKWNYITSNVTGCGCGKPKLSDIIQPDSKPKPKPISSSNSDHTSTSLDSPSPPLDFDQTVDIKSSNNLPSKIVGSVAVVKDSDDPFKDFRQSMLQMIMEKEIYSCDDLNELLNCFLKLNSSSHHDVIVQAFMEIWNNGKIE